LWSGVYFGELRISTEPIIYQYNNKVHRTLDVVVESRKIESFEVFQV